MSSQSPSTPTSSRRQRSAGAKARSRKRVQDAGIALVMVTGAIVVLTVMLAEFQEESGAEVAAATSARDSLQAEYFARSGLNLARLLIASEPTIRAAIAPLFAFMKKTPPQIPVWEFTDRILFAFNGEELDEDEDGNEETSTASMSFATGEGKNLKLPGGNFELMVVDEDSKIDVNQGASNEISRVRVGKQLAGLFISPQYNPLFEQRDDQGQFNDRATICAAIIDWADVDEMAFFCDFSGNAQNGGGAEDSFYQTLRKPYRRKNAPYDSLEELHRVRGVNQDFWATFVDPDPSDPKKRSLTIWGQGAINVNTANPQTLLAVVCSGAPLATICVDPLQASFFLTGVTMARAVTMGAPLFGSPTDFVHAVTGKGQLGPLLTSIGMQPVKFQSEAQFAKTIATESKVFSVYSAGVKKSGKRETRVGLHAVVDFRTAPVIGAAGTAGLTGATPAPSGSVAPPMPSGAMGGTNPTGMATGGVVQPATGGQIIYFRMQ